MKSLFSILSTIGMIAIMAITATTTSAQTASEPVELTCEYLTDPLGLLETSPRLAWKVNDPRRGAKQTAYQILVSTGLDELNNEQGNVWDTGKVDSDRCIQIEYAGPALQADTYYFWKVRTWDADGKPSPYSRPALWEMGILDANDWQAQWVSMPEALTPFIVRNHGYHSKAPSNPDSPKWVIVDLGKKRRFNAIELFPAYSRDKTIDGYLFPSNFKVEVSDDMNFGDPILIQENLPNPGPESRRFSVPETQARYVRFTATKLQKVPDRDEYAFALAELEVLDGETNIAKGCPCTALDSHEVKTWSLEFLCDGLTEPRDEKNPESGPGHYLRKEFQIPNEIQRATVYVTALGLFELTINGERVGQNILAPEWTDYHTRIQVQTFDVTELLKKGDNAIGAILGEGWYAGQVGLYNRMRMYGDRLALLAELHIQGTDDSRTIVATDGSWRGTTDGPIRQADLIRGEHHDARKAMPGWNKTGFDDSAWKLLKVLPKVQAELVAQPNEPIQVTQVLKPIAMTEPSPGVYVFDLGQNMVGNSSLKLRGPAGTKVTVRHAEVLQPDGNIYTENLRGDYQHNSIILSKADEDDFHTHFTYHGFRYVEVTGLPEKPLINDVRGNVFHSASPPVGRFECSSPMLNKLMENIVWTQRGNMHSTPTDCPQRDERMGWMGDAEIFSQAACFNLNMAGFFTKWIQDIRDAQTEIGQYSDFSPNPRMLKGEFVGVPAWADAGIICPWRMYENYADVRLLSKHYESAKRWIGYVQSQSPELIWIKGRGNDYGDWLNGDTLILKDWPKGADTPREVLATAMFAHSTELVAKMATVLGKAAEAKQYAQLAADIKKAFQREFVDENGRIRGDNQSIYGLALHFELIPDDMRETAIKYLLEKIDAYDGHISTGIVATNRMMMELARMGHADVAYKLLNNRTIPSWGYMIDNGATTIWERWDGWVDGRGFQNTGMNSFNHYAIGAVGEWMYRNIAGINPDPDVPAYKHFIIRPRPGGGLSFARAAYDSIHGEIATEWKQDNDQLIVNVQIPANTSATVYIPAKNPRNVKESGKPAADQPYVKFLREEDGFAVFEVQAGRYVFEG